MGYKGSEFTIQGKRVTVRMKLNTHRHMGIGEGAV